MHCEICSWSNVRLSRFQFRKAYYDGIKLSVTFFFHPHLLLRIFSITLRNEWLFDIRWWIYCPENGPMANSSHRLLWILWWYFVHGCSSTTQIETGCKSFDRQLFGSYDWSSRSNIRSDDQNCHPLLCKNAIKTIAIVSRWRQKYLKKKNKNQLSIYILKLNLAALNCRGPSLYPKIYFSFFSITIQNYSTMQI